MAVIDVDLGSSDGVVTDTDGSEVTLIDITALGSHTLTVDGADAEIHSIANVTALAAPTFNAINGAMLTVDLGFLDISALSSFTFGVGDTSTVVLDASAITTVASILNAYTVVYSGSGTGNFIYDPAVSVLSTVRFNVSGMEAGDTFTVSGISNNLSISGYDEATQTMTLHYGSYTGLLVQSVWVDVSGVTAEDYAAIQASLSDSDPSNDLITDDTFTFPSSTVVCFVQGTRIETPKGSLPVETLKVGDLVLTADHGARPIRWVGSKQVPSHRLGANEKIRPIRIRAGALGAGVPLSDLAVSPQHRVLVRSKIAEKMFGEIEVLIPAKQLLQIDGIEVAHDLTELCYFHLLLDRHEILIANGAESESFYTGPSALKAVGLTAREEILALCPGLVDQGAPPPARPLVFGARARKLAQRHVKNQKPLVTQAPSAPDASAA
ncbi:MAG: Hint domain-containing protein [Pseudodonghicola sp.]